MKRHAGQERHPGLRNEHITLTDGEGKHRVGTLAGGQGACRGFQRDQQGGLGAHGCPLQGTGNLKKYLTTILCPV
jgi:hypothetical protein